MRSGSEPVPVGLPEKPYPGMDGNDDVKSVFGVASECSRIRERTDELELLDDGSRPSRA